MTDSSFDDRPATRPDLVVEEIDGELVVFDPVRGAVHEIDKLGTIIWPFLDGTAPVDDLVADLADAFGESPERVRHDLEALLELLADRGLLVRAADDPPRTRPSPRTTGYLVDPPSP